MRKILKAFAFAGLIFLVSVTQAATIDLPVAQETIIVSNSLVLLDSNKTYTAETIVDQLDAFVQDDSNQLFSESVKNYWLRFTLVNTGQYDRQYILNFDKWSEVHLHTLQGLAIGQTYHTGHLVPYLERNYPEGNQSLIRLTVASKDSVQCLVHLETRPDQLIKPVDLSFTVAERGTVDLKNSKVRQTIFLFVGILMIMFLYHIFVFFSIRNRSYLLYLVIVGGTLYMTLNNSGYNVSALSFWSGFPQFRGLIESLTSSLVAIFSILFTRQLLQTKLNMPRHHKVLTVFIWLITILTIAINLGGSMFGPLIFLVSFLLMGLFISVGITAVVRKVPSGGYYLMAYTFSMTGIMIYFMALSGGIEASNFTLHYSMPLGYSLEMVLYSLALANIINVLKRENEEKQVKIIEQLVENEELATMVNRELEGKVIERTQEISEQKKMLEQEKEKSDELLLNILPADMAEELKVNGKATPKHYQDISILFTDFEDFTHISKGMSTKELVENLDECFSAFDDIVHEFGLEKIKTIGDAYMCAQGLSDDDPEPGAVVKAALKMRDFVDVWNKGHRKNNRMVWPIRIGVNTGAVSAGVVGKKKFTYDIWGDSVNLAARMESAGEPGAVNISQFTREKLGDEFVFTKRGEIPVKNFGQVEMYFVEEADKRAE